MTVSRYELNLYQNGFNLMIQKGYNGEEQMVQELAKEGARLEDAIYGAAFGGYHPLVQKMLAKNPELINAAVKGYAHAKNLKETIKYGKYPTALTHGFALAGDETQVRAALNSRDGQKYLPAVIEGLATTKQEILLLELVANTRYYPNALQAAAKSGHSQLVEVLLEKLSINLKTLKKPLSSNIQTTLGYVLKGYSEGRHFPEAIAIMELGINPMICLNALAINGELDATDASLLLAAVKKTELNNSLKNLMDTQFGLHSDKINTQLVLQPKPENSENKTSKPI